jgi:hypothetical protein
MLNTPLFQGDHSSSRSFFSRMEMKSLLFWKRAYQKVIAIEDGTHPLKVKAAKCPWMLPLWKEGLQVVIEEIENRQRHG